MDENVKAAVLKWCDNVEGVALRALNDLETRGIRRRMDRPLRLGRAVASVDYPGRVEDTR